MTYGPWTDSTVKGLWRTVGGRSVRNEELSRRLDAERITNRQFCIQWRDAAIADGWRMSATYDHEPAEQAFTLDRDGYKILGLARPCDPQHGMPPPSINIWGPDKLAIMPPLIYSFEAIERGAKTCMECNAYPVDTERVGFAGRYCKSCAERLRPSIEHPGWNS